MSDVKYPTNNFGIDGFKDDLFDNFVVWHGSCEQDESVSIASQIIEKTDDANVLKNIYALLKQFEEKNPSWTLSLIRARESFLDNPNTPTECIIDISESNLQYDYMVEYYGGYGGDDYKVYTNLATKTKDTLLNRNIKEINPNLEYFLKMYEVEGYKEQINMAFENGDIESGLQMKEKHNIVAEELNILTQIRLNKVIEKAIIEIEETESDLPIIGKINLVKMELKETKGLVVSESNIKNIYIQHLESLKLLKEQKVNSNREDLKYYPDDLNVVYELSDSIDALNEIEETLLKFNQNIQSPTIDECLQQIEEEEAAKLKVKSPSL